MGRGVRIGGEVGKRRIALDPRLAVEPRRLEHPVEQDLADLENLPSR